MEPVIERITALFYQCWSLYARDCFNDFATIREQSGKNVYTNLEFSPSILPDACQREFRSKVIILLAFFNIMLYEIGTSTHHFRMTG